MAWLWVSYIVVAWKMLARLYKDLEHGSKTSLLARLLKNDASPRVEYQVRVNVAFILTVLSLSFGLQLATCMPLTLFSIALKQSGYLMFRWISMDLVRFAWNVSIFASSTALYGLLPFGLLHPSSTGLGETIRTMLVFYGLLVILVYAVGMVLGLNIEQSALQVLNGICTLPYSIAAPWLWAHGTRSMTESIIKRWMPNHVREALLDRIAEMEMERVHVHRKLHMHGNPPPLPQRQTSGTVIRKGPSLEGSRKSSQLGPWGLQAEEQLQTDLARLEDGYSKIHQKLRQDTWRKNVRTISLIVWAVLSEVSVGMTIVLGIIGDSFQAIQEYSQGAGIFKRLVRFWVSVIKGILGGLRDEDLKEAYPTAMPTVWSIPVLLYFTLCMFYALARSKPMVAIRSRPSFVMGTMAAFLALTIALPVICDVLDLFSIQHTGLYAGFRLFSHQRGFRTVYRLLFVLFGIYARIPALRRLVSLAK
jgi:hypothetical protein